MIHHIIPYIVRPHSLHKWNFIPFLPTYSYFFWQPLFPSLFLWTSTLSYDRNISNLACQNGTSGFPLCLPPSIFSTLVKALHLLWCTKKRKHRNHLSPLSLLLRSFLIYHQNRSGFSFFPFLIPQPISPLSKHKSTLFSVLPLCFFQAILHKTTSVIF